MLLELVENRFEEREIGIFALFLRLVVVCRPRDLEELALPRDRKRRMVGLYNFGSVPYSCLYFFFRNSFST